MNYRHAYHAGSFADVLKHVVLVEIIKILKQKEKPFFYLDTHAGRGCYDLASVEAGKTGEAESGIQCLLHENLPLLLDYINTVKACQHKPSDYPGSPLLVRKLLRATDRMVVNELHPQELLLLQALFARDRQVQVTAMDAYQTLKALLPPTPRRGLVLIDPAFEVEDEFDRIIAGLREALQRWTTGIYAIWYPIKVEHEVDRFIRKIEKFQLPFMALHLQVLAHDGSSALKATGMVILNPPYLLESHLQKILPVLSKALSAKNGLLFEGKFAIMQKNLKDGKV